MMLENTEYHKILQEYLLEMGRNSCWLKRIARVLIFNPSINPFKIIFSSNPLLDRDPLEPSELFHILNSYFHFQLREHCNLKNILYIF